MLKHEMFSNSYLNYRRNKNLENEEHIQVKGNLAVSARKNLTTRTQPVCRTSSRIWWESGWKMLR
ncbi:MAG: hypothetical protein ACQETH_01510 [Candidatus Rifleibacteriota bacterium]